MQNYQLLLYRRALHPDLFSIKSRHNVQHGAYELEAWVLPGGHVLRFRFGTMICCELVIDQPHKLPLEGAVTAFPCMGEHDFAHKFLPERVGYMASAHHEVLPESLFNSTLEELLKAAAALKEGSLVHTWTDPLPEPRSVQLPQLSNPSKGFKNASILEIQGLNKQVHVSGYHLLGASGVVIRTQSIFEHH